MTDQGFRKRSEDPIAAGVVVSMVSATYEAPDGTTFRRDVVRHPGAVVVVPIDGDDAVLVRQFRSALGRTLLEIPAGKRDVEGEPPDITAARELQEEVGLVAGELEHVATFHNSPGFTDEESWCFLATDLREVERDAQGIEERYMTVERVALDTVPALIACGELTDAKSIIGLLLALQRRGR